PTLMVDGGAARNNWLMQFQADISNVKIIRAADLETTALGAAFLAGLAVGYWQDLDELKSIHQTGNVFQPRMAAPQRANLYQGWQAAVKAAQLFKHIPIDAQSSTN
ncbi:glycerol kinase, partial [Lactiplantibacillus plantarum]|nr:glycerol kinase [Lactiplantibacillus plantarum]